MSTVQTRRVFVRVGVAYDATTCSGCDVETRAPTAEECEQISKENETNRAINAAHFREGWARLDFPLSISGYRTPQGEEPTYLCPKCAAGALEYVRSRK